MRRIVVTEFLTVDGVAESPERWVPSFWSEETGNYKLTELRSHDAQLLGRRTYETFAAAWPQRSDPDGFADRMNGMPKYVVSSTLTKPQWNNSAVISGNLEAEIARLKASPGGDILVAGSGSLVNFLLRTGLADEYRLMIFPTLAGRGKRLFSNENNAIDLELRETIALPHGVCVLTYVPAMTPPAGEFPDHFTLEKEA